MRTFAPLHDATNTVRPTSATRFKLVGETPQRNSYGTPDSVSGITPSTTSSGRRSDAPGSVHKRPPSATPGRSLFHRTPKSTKRDYLLKDVSTAPALTVVLDLDETLVSNRRADQPAAVLRPHAIEFLVALRQIPGVEIVLWTASTEDTGRPVVGQLHERGDIFDHVIYRNDLWFTEPIHTKDLRLLGRDMSRVVVFDNAPNCVKLNPRNAVLVEDFHAHFVNDPDRTLPFMYNIIRFLTQHTLIGHNVQDLLQIVFTEGYRHEVADHIHEVYYQLPTEWSNVDLHQCDPIMVPPHGRYFRIRKQ